MITQAEVKRLFKYDPKTGNLIRRVSRGCKHGLKGSIAGTKHNGYIRIKVNDTTYSAHRLIWLYHEGYMPENPLDHINRKRDDNRIENLREVSLQCNIRNTGNPKNNSSGVKGISWINLNRKWRAQIRVDKKQYYLGLFNDFTEAVYYRLAAEQCLDWSSCDARSPAQKYIDNLSNA